MFYCEIAVGMYCALPYALSQVLSHFVHACSFRYIPWFGNKVAYILASDGSLGSEDCFWVEEVSCVAQSDVDEDRHLSKPP
ncbi:hypothetical protein V6N13_056882 [Hibiscus sabdariffa]|uniref:Uncharacterized protein n=1 Tax=Hibiscus sabdariffa TaxID=183260 RepID=A0ABR2PJI8_9ROSI